MVDEVKKSAIDWTKVKFYQKQEGIVGLTIQMLMPALEEILANNIDLAGVDAVFMSPTQKTKDNWKSNKVGSYSSDEYELEFKNGERVVHTQLIYEWLESIGRDDIPKEYHTKPQENYPF